MDRIFLVSNYNTDCEWIKQYNVDYLIYDRSDNNKILDFKNVVKVENIGCNIYDYFTYFIDYYEDLHQYICLLKGNLFTEENNKVICRHIDKNKFDKVIFNNFFTFLCNHYDMQDREGIAIKGCEGGYLEYNNNWYMPNLEKKFFNSYNDFFELRICKSCFA